MMSVNRERQEF